MGQRPLQIVCRCVTPVHLSSYWQIDVFSMWPSKDPSTSGNPNLGLCLSEPMAPGHVASNPLPRLSVSNERQTAEFVAGALCHLGHNRLGLHKSLKGLCTCSHCLCLLCVHQVQAFLHMLLRNLGSTPQETLIFVTWISWCLCHFQDWLHVCGF